MSESNGFSMNKRQYTVGVFGWTNSVLAVRYQRVGTANWLTYDYRVCQSARWPFSFW